MSDKEKSQLGKDLEAIRREILEEEKANPNDAPGLGGAGAEPQKITIIEPLKSTYSDYNVFDFSPLLVEAEQRGAEQERTRILALIDARIAYYEEGDFWKKYDDLRHSAKSLRLFRDEITGEGGKE